MRKSLKPPLDFIGYIQTLKITDTLQGKFIKDAQRDLDLVNARCWKQLQEYLDFYTTGVRDDFYPVARTIWRKYHAKYPAYLYRS